MAELTKKSKEVNFGITEELKNFLNDWTDRTLNKSLEITEGKKIGIEVKEAIVEIAKRELEKVDGELNKRNVKDDEWYHLIEKVDKISDLVRWF